MAAEKARLEEEAQERERTLEEACQAAEVQAWVEEEARKQEEEWCVREEEERDLREEGGPSWERAPWRRLFFLLSDSAGSPECCCVCGYSIWLLYQDGKEKDNSLCSFVPGGATAVPCWEIWALACRISAESESKML